MTVAKVLLEPSVHAVIDELVADSLPARGCVVFVGVSRDVFGLLSDAPVTAELLLPPSDEHDALVNVSIDRDQGGLEATVRLERAGDEFVEQGELLTPLLGDHDGYDSLCRYGMSPVDAWRAVYAS